jgi:farnesyl diphosphate synthase
MALTQELDRVAKLIEERLDALLQLESVASGEARLIEAMRYAVLGGGKRLRPFLLIESARLFGVAEEAALDPGAALECVHCYSLVHDDLPSMDDDKVRRGRPTAHIAFGEATAILAGDALLTLAFDILSRPSKYQDAGVRVELIGLLAQAAGAHGMAGGQALDLAAEGQSVGPIEVAKMQSMKTGALFAFACDTGAVLGRAEAVSRGALSAYAAAFGQAFQLADDLLDAEGDAAAMGKAAGKDAGRGKATLVALLGIDAAWVRLKTLVDDAEAALAPFGDRGATLKDAARFIALRRA